MANEGMRPPTPDAEQRRIQRHESHAGSTYANFLKDLCSISGMDAGDAEKAAVSVLCTLEQRIYGEEVEDLESQLPSKLRDLLQRCERHQGKPTKKFGRDQFFQMVADDLGISVDNVEPTIRAVFSAVRAQVSEGEANNVADQLPSDIAELWQLPA